jgi:hypothetical protein
VFKLASHVVRNGALDPVDAVGWVARLCLALEVLHRVGCSHGRISAKAIQALGPSSAAAGFFLDTGDLLDDVAYFSPERVKGAPHSPEDDTWAAGVLLYVLLTAQLPFPGTSPQQVAGRMLAGAPRSLSSFDIHSSSLQGVIDAVLSRTTDGRLTSIVELRNRLITCVPACEPLTALKLGKPDVGLLTEERTDTQGEQLTDIMSREAVKQKVREALRRRDAARRAAESGSGAHRGNSSMSPPPQQPLSGSVPPPRRSVPPPGQSVPPPRRSLPPPRQSVPPARPASTSQRPAPMRKQVLMATPPSGATPGVSASRPPPPQQPAARSAPAIRPEPSPTGPTRALDGARVDPLAAPSGRPPRRSRRAILATLLAIAVGVGAWLVLDPTAIDRIRGMLPGGANGPSASASAATPSTSSPQPRASSSAKPTAQPSAVSSPRQTPADVGRCVRSLFPEDTFPGSGPDFDWVCRQSNARKGGNRLRVAVVRAGARGVTQGMREWAELGWYEMTAFVLASARCCAQPPKLATTPAPSACELNVSLERFRTVALGSDDGAVDDALGDFRAAAICIVRKGAAGPYGQRRLPGKAARRVFQRTLDRARPK